MNKFVEQGISDIVGCLTDPIIVFPGGWGDTLPDWLKTAITLERMMGDMKALKGKEPTGTDAEACAYLMTLSLTQPMDSDWTQIYLYIAGQSYIPSVIVLWGSRSAQVRIFTDYLVAVREQEYQGYWHYLLDFRNGFWQSPIDNYRSHYACLHITRFKD